MDISTFGKRLASAMAIAGISEPEMSNVFAVSRQTVNNWVNGKNEPKFDTAVKIAKLLNVTLDWLLSGEESTFKPPVMNLEDIKGSDAKPAAAEFYPLIDRVTAGDFSANVVAEHIVEYYPVSYHRKNCFLVEVEGDSMVSPDPEQSIYPGDFLLVDPMETVTPGDLVVVKLTSTRHMVKQFFKGKDDIELRSFNPAHPTIYLDGDTIEYIFRVVFHQPRGRKW